MAGFRFAPQPQSSRLFRNLGRRSRPCYRCSLLFASIDSLRSLLPLANAPLGHRFLHSPPGRSLVSVEKADDEISSTGGRRRLSPRPVGPEPKIWSVFPVISASFRNLPSAPVFAGFFRLLPGISAYFQTVLKWTFGHLLHFYRFSCPLQPSGLHP